MSCTLLFSMPDTTWSFIRSATQTLQTAGLSGWHRLACSSSEFPSDGDVPSLPEDAGWPPNLEQGPCFHTRCKPPNDMGSLEVKGLRSDSCAF